MLHKLDSGEFQMVKPIQAVLLGAGGRGLFTFGDFATQNPDQLKFVAVAEPDDYRREKFAEIHGISSQNCFTSWEELMKVDQVSSVLFNTTMDNSHFASSMAALEKGYDVVLEKPMAPTPQECSQLVAKSTQLGKKLIIFHEMRYTKFFKTVFDIVQSGKLGELVNVEHRENVVFWHYVHSFVRGNWRNTKDSAPFILAKCCHDLDLLYWIIGHKVKRLSSFGSLKYFKPSSAPREDLPERCTDGCPIEETCIFFAPRLYSGPAKKWRRILEFGEDTANKSLDEILKVSDYGRCAYKCDNNVVDNQVVNLQFENGILANFVTTAFANEPSRYVRLDGTKGTLIGELSGTNSQLIVSDHLSGNEESIDLETKYDEGQHGGGDSEMLFDIVNNLKVDQSIVHSVEDALESHLMALAAEESRLNDGAIIDMEGFKSRYI